MSGFPYTAIVVSTSKNSEPYALFLNSKSVKEAIEEAVTLATKHKHFDGTPIWKCVKVISNLTFDTIHFQTF